MLEKREKYKIIKTILHKKDLQSVLFLCTYLKARNDSQFKEGSLLNFENLDFGFWILPNESYNGHQICWN